MIAAAVSSAPFFTLLVTERTTPAPVATEAAARVAESLATGRVVARPGAALSLPTSASPSSLRCLPSTR